MSTRRAVVRLGMSMFWTQLVVCVCLSFFAVPPAAQAGPQAAAAIADRRTAFKNATRRSAPPQSSETAVKARAGAEILFAWRQVLPGLEIAVTELEESKAAGRGALFIALRIDPDEHDFTLSMASHDGKAMPLAQWSERDNLRAGINAGMYLPDMLTSTGYMRRGREINNPRLGTRLGAFFVAGPRRKGLPGADIIERAAPDWRARLDEYATVVQNYRFMDAEGNALWRSGGVMHSMAVVGVDAKGRLLFVLNQEPLTPGRFAWYLRRLRLDLRSVMYVEGGTQAGLFLRLENDAKSRGGEKDKDYALPGAETVAVPGGVVHVWKGRQSLLNTRGNVNAPLPNIIGIRRKAETP